MPYVSLYRKYRSQAFEDVMGQDHVTRTLQNAIKAGRIGHAYLFCGSRGTGKTTVARLLAKALNCEKGPTPQPCNDCAACRAITEGNAVDVVEMDAASHRGVDDMEMLREGVKYPPMQLRYKIYIIDEAHQLSAHAKDAFLKTLEEPPPHAVFILATTEAHEIPLTIKSRCQQFDFRRGSLTDIAERLRFVCESEGVRMEPAALDTIARGAAGSWRDGLSLLEQVMAYTDQEITLRDVNAVLGTVERETLFEAAEVMAKKDAGAAFALADRLLAEGKDIRDLLRAMAGHFRDLLLAQSGPVEQEDEESVRLREQAALFTRQKLLSLVEILSEADKQTKWTDQHRLLLEMALLKGLEEPEVTSAAVRQAVAERPAPRATPPPSFQRPAVASATPAGASRMEKPKVKPEPQAVERQEETLPEGDITIEEVVDRWPAVLKIFKGSKDASLHPVLAAARPLRIENGNTLVVGFRPEREFDRNKVEEPFYRQAIGRTLGHVLHRKVRIVTESMSPELLEMEAPLEESDQGAGSLLDAVLSTFPGSIVEEIEPAAAEEEKNPWEGDENA